MAGRPHSSSLRPQRPRRRMLRVLARIVLVLCLPPLAWLVWNRIDEAPNADALRWGNPPEREVPDADNAWLYLLGIGAAENDDPIAYGRRRVDAYVARARRDPQAKADPLEDDRNAAMPYVGSVEGIDGIAQLCPPHGPDCIGWAAAHRAALGRLADANRLRLQRLDTAIALPQWQEAPLLSSDFPTPSMQLVVLKINLLALDANDSRRIPAVAEEIARHAALWRRASEDAEWLLSKAFGGAFMERYQRLLVELYEHAKPAQREALQPAIDSVFAAPTAAATNLDVVGYDSFQMTAVALRGEIPSLWQSLRNCMHGTPKNGSCSNDLVSSTTYLPQATDNIVARIVTASADFLAASPADEPAAAERLAQRVGREDPSRGDAPLALKIYNAAGRRLALQSVLEPVYRKRLNDQETVRRMLLIKLAALHSHVPAANMPEFLAAQQNALRHPYPGKSIVWRPGQRAFAAPAAVENSFENGFIVVPHHAPSSASAAPPPPQNPSQAIRY